MTMNDADPRDPVVTGDDVRNVKFGKGGYDKPQVDDLLDRIAAELDAGRPAGPLIANATIKTRNSVHGYEVDAVNWFLEQFRTAEHSELAQMNADPWRDLAVGPYCIHREPGDPAWRIRLSSPQEYADAWRDFARQPGTRLSWVRTGAGRRELRTTNLQTIASRAGLHTTLTAGGRTFTWKRVRSSWPGIADTISREDPDDPADMSKRKAGGKDPWLTQLRDETGIPVLYTAAGPYIKFPGRRWLRFPIRGTKRANAIMTAVDQAGNKVARYRLIRDGSVWRTIYGGSVWRTTEITVHPDQRLTDELALAIAISAPWLDAHFVSHEPPTWAEPGPRQRRAGEGCTAVVNQAPEMAR
jgi:DivIVA domain-containing protein